MKHFTSVLLVLAFAVSGFMALGCDDDNEKTDQSNSDSVMVWVPASSEFCKANCAASGNKCDDEGVEETEGSPVDGYILSSNDIDCSHFAAMHNGYDIPLFIKGTADEGSGHTCVEKCSKENDEKSICTYGVTGKYVCRSMPVYKGGDNEVDQYLRDFGSGEEDFDL